MARTVRSALAWTTGVSASAEVYAVYAAIGSSFRVRLRTPNRHGHRTILRLVGAVGGIEGDAGEQRFARTRGSAERWRSDFSNDGFDCGASPVPFRYGGVAYPSLGSRSRVVIGIADDVPLTAD